MSDTSPVRRIATEEAVAFLDSAPLARDDLEKIYAGNAERVFGIGRRAPGARSS
jgi:predicted TIM-barrel fold metal-dependent hydrolase